MIGFTQEYFTPFLLLLGATARHIGMLSALPNFFASLIQIKSADLSERLKSRKKVIITFVLFVSMMSFAVNLSSPFFAGICILVICCTQLLL